MAVIGCQLRMHFNSIRVKYTVAGLAICIFSITLVSSYSYFSSYNITSELSDRMIKEKVEKTSNELNYWFSVYANAISHVIHDMKAFDNYAPDHLHPFLISKVETYREKVSDFYFAYEASNRTLSGIGWIPPAEYVATSRPWYKKAKSAKGIVFTEPYVDAMTGDLVITVAHVLENDGRIMGVLASDIFLSEIVKVVENSRLNENSYGMLLDEKGRIIVHPNEDSPAKRWRILTVSMMCYAAVNVAE